MVEDGSKIKISEAEEGKKMERGDSTPEMRNETALGLTTKE